jgi:3-dehydroquinate dehydratase type I
MVVVLVGFMGAGKTTVGQIMAERLGLPFVDSDVLIEQRDGRAIKDIFRTEGEQWFRQLEHETVADLVGGPEAVVALGGGAAEDQRSRAVLRAARVVHLRVSYDEALSRVQADAFRPMLQRPDLDEVYRRRLPVYEDVSALTVDTDGRSPEAIAGDALAGLSRIGAPMTGNKLAASLAPADTDSGLRELERLATRIGLAEVRLDLMASFDVEKLVASSPVPLVLTCRPERERGGFAGPEDERLAVLRAAYHAGAAYIDVETDTLDRVAGWNGSPTRIIASQHWYDTMPAGLHATYLGLRDRCDVVKLVGTAHVPADVFPVLELLDRATTPVVTMAMGAVGTCTRILAPAFPQTLLTYGAVAAASLTAPGQITIDEMTDWYALDAVSPATAIYLHVTWSDRGDQDVLDTQARAPRGRELHVSLRTVPGQAAALAARAADTLPGVTVQVERRLT